VAIFRYPCRPPLLVARRPREIQVDRLVHKFGMAPFGQVELRESNTAV